MIQMKTKVFNAFNPVNSTNPSLARTAPLTFGEFQQTTPPREMQFALRVAIRVLKFTGRRGHVRRARRHLRQKAGRCVDEALFDR